MIVRIRKLLRLGSRSILSRVSVKRVLEDPVGKVDKVDRRVVSGIVRFNERRV